MKNIISKFINVEKPRKKLTEAEVNDDSIQVYMNTWKNYNSYGADLEAYGIKDGWMSLDDAIAFAEKYAEDEPFINDIENSPVEISEYDSIDKLKELKEYEDCDDKEVVKAILQSGHTDDISEAISIADSGDYLWLPGVDSDSSLAEAYIDMCGGIMEAVGEDRIDNYFDEDAWKRDSEDDFRNMIADNEDKDVDDVTDEEVEEFADSVLQDEMSTAKYDHNDDFFTQYFDYEAYGRDLGFDFTFVDDGAISIY